MSSAGKPRQPNTHQSDASRRVDSLHAAQREAARSRMAQRRRQQLKQQVQQRMRTFESLLPGLPETGGVALPRWDLAPLKRLVGSRLLWALLAALTITGGLTAWFALDERWYIYREDVHFNGLNYLDAEELWRLSAIDGWQVFWIDADEVGRRLRQNPYVAEARVHIAPFAAKVTVDITEVRPVALWVTDAGTLWLREDGLALAPRGATPPGLLQILDGPADATLAGAPRGSAIDPGVLRSGQALANRLPGVSPLRYNALVGLNFRLPNSPYWVYWGDGDEVEAKLENLAAAELLLASGRAQGSVIDLRFERPYIK
ncbi:MAG: FtsQ-type POTRA domain-containing protein [Caldilinea sp.]|nr:FtsQ-type POTRA domain-containing protein [Caldilinea sp.]MDW8439248.1 FtsQ-type POTRA domain-containing protein [Caldilineaceae bacterium]